MWAENGEKRALVRHAKNEFNTTWSQVLTKAGCAGKAKRVKPPWKTLDEVAKEIMRLKKQNVDVNAIAMKKGTDEQRRLFKFVTENLKKPWSEALQKANLTDEAKKNKPYPWKGNLQKIIARLRQIARKQEVHAEAVRASPGSELASLYSHVRNQYDFTWTDLLRKAELHGQRGFRRFQWYGNRKRVIQRLAQILRPGQRHNALAVIRRRGEHVSIYRYTTKRLGIPWHDALTLAGINPYEHVGGKIPTTPAILQFLHAFVAQRLIEQGVPGLENHWKANYPKEFTALKNWKMNGKAFGGHGTWFDYIKNKHQWLPARMEKIRRQQRGIP